MSFVTTDEQKALRQTVRSFLESKSDEAAVRAAMVSELGFDRGLWDQLAGQLGLAGLAIPEEYGGSGSSMSDLAVVMSELGRFLVCSPYLASAVMAANALVESGDKQACLAYLPRLASGELLAALAVNEQTVRAGTWRRPHLGANRAAMTGRSPARRVTSSQDLRLTFSSSRPRPRTVPAFS